MNFGKTLVSQLGMILLITMVTVTSSAAPSWNGSLGTENGWPLVSNPMQSMEGDQTIAAEEVWRLGDEDDEQETIFGLIGDGLVDKQGNTYLLDTILSTIYKVGPDGTILANLGHEGDGPGEFRNAQSMVFLPGGDLGIHEMMPGGISTLGLDGQPKPRFSNGVGGSAGMRHIMNMDADENSVVIGQTATDLGGNQGITSVHSLASYARDGSLIKTFFEEKEEMTGGRIVLGGDGHDFAQYWCLGSGGRVVVFQENQEYKLEVFDAAGEPEMIIRREYKPVNRSDKDIARDERQREAMRKRFGSMDSSPIPKIARHITGAYTRPNGNLWVKNSQGDSDCPENSIGYFDVFNKAGQYVKRIRIEADYDPARDNFRIAGHHLLVFKEAQKAPDRTATSGGGQMTMIMVSSGSADEEDDDEEPRPYEVVFYRLP